MQGGDSRNFSFETIHEHSHETIHEKKKSTLKKLRYVYWFTVYMQKIAFSFLSFQFFEDYKPHFLGFRSQRAENGTLFYCPSVHAVGLEPW